MKFTIIGAGAVGSIVGSCLSRAGRQVELVDTNEEHVAAIRNRGLRVDRSDGDSTTSSIMALRPSELDSPLDTVLLCVKTAATHAAVIGLQPYLTDTSVVVSLQNGFNEFEIAELIGSHRTIGSFINFGGLYVGPGHVIYSARGSFLLGELDGRISERLHNLASELGPIGDVALTDNIFGYLWTKFAYLAALAAVALVDELRVTILERYPALMIELMTEVFEVAERERVSLVATDAIEPGAFVPRSGRDQRACLDAFGNLIAHARTHGKPKTAGLYAFLRGEQPESLAHLDLAIRIAKRHGLELPICKRVLTMTREVADGVRDLGWHNLDELEAFRGRVSADT